MSDFIRLHVAAEGQAEEQFVKRTLTEHLGSFRISTDVRRVLTRRERKHIFHRGGLNTYAKVKRDIQAWLKEDNEEREQFHRGSRRYRRRFLQRTPLDVRESDRESP